MGHDTLQDKLNKNVVGMAEMRTRQAEVMDLVSNHFETVFLRDNKRNACSRTAMLLHPELCGVLLEAFRFEPRIETKKQNHILEVPEIGASGKGATRTAALESLTEDVLNQVRAYFSEMDLHARLPETRTRFPWFLKILQCRSEKEVIRCLNLDEFRMTAVKEAGESADHDA